MGFDYDKIKKQNSEPVNFWTSYSDLFLMMSVVFLLLYVISSLRSGSFGVQKNAEYQALSKEAQDLREQIKVYNSLREEQVKQMPEDEAAGYKQLMDKLSLLQENAKNEKEDLRKKAFENEQKEVALNKYQQMIRNIINTNVLAKTQIARRDQMIQTKETVIAKQGSKIAELNTQIGEKESIIAENNEKISDIRGELAKKIDALKEEQQRSNTSKKALQQAISELKESSAEQINELNAKNRAAADEISKVQTNLSKVQANLHEKTTSLEQVSNTLENVKAQSSKEREALIAQLEKTKGDFQSQIAAMEEANRKQRADERAAFERDLNAQKLTAAEREAKEAEFRKKAEAQARDAQGRLQDLEGRARATQERLAAAEAEEGKAVSDLQNAKAQGLKERQALIAALEKAKGDFQAQIAAMEAANRKARADERAAFERDLNAQKLSAADREAKEADFRKRAEAEAREAQGRLNDLEGKAQQAQQRLAAAQQDQTRALAAVEGLKKENATMRELAEARKNLANAIRRNFKNAGIQAEVDVETGDVTLDFPQDYFETGQASLKPSMETRLRKFIPAYTKSLFSDPNIAKKIANVEIIGFASSTYRGKYVNPLSLNEHDRDAIDYNLKLSFNRANSIFKFIFDKSRLTYQHQERLLPLVKVVGRGYLPAGVQATEIPEGMSERDFCEQYNCKKAQKVVVKFNLEN